MKKTICPIAANIIDDELEQITSGDIKLNDDNLDSPFTEYEAFKVIHNRLKFHNSLRNLN